MITIEQVDAAWKVAHNIESAALACERRSITCKTAEARERNRHNAAAHWHNHFAAWARAVDLQQSFDAR